MYMYMPTTKLFPCICNENLAKKILLLLLLHLEKLFHGVGVWSRDFNIIVNIIKYINLATEVEICKNVCPPYFCISRSCSME
jgi:hypothetical protein